MTLRLRSPAIVLALAAFAALAAAMAAVVSCANSQSGDDEELWNLTEALMPVSSAVDGYINFLDAPIDLDGKELLDKATEHNPRLLERFAGYAVLVRREGLASSVLVCDTQRTRALMEDSGCTSGKFDARLWESPSALPCDFQLDLREVCKAR